MVYVIIHIISIYPRSVMVVVRFGMFLSTVIVAPDANNISALILSRLEGLSGVWYHIARTACSPCSRIAFGGF